MKRLHPYWRAQKTQLGGGPRTPMLPDKTLTVQTTRAVEAPGGLQHWGEPCDGWTGSGLSPSTRAPLTAAAQHGRPHTFQPTHMPSILGRLILGMHHRLAMGLDAVDLPLSSSCRSAFSLCSAARCGRQLAGVEMEIFGLAAVGWCRPLVG